MFRAAVFTVDKMWKQLEHSTRDKYNVIYGIPSLIDTEVIIWGRPFHKMAVNISKLSVPHFIEKNEHSRSFLGYGSLGKFLSHFVP